MKKIQSNLHYYKISKENPEKFLDQNYMFVEKDLGMSFYVSKTHKIKELLTTFKNYNKCSAKLSKRGKFSNKNIKKFFGISIGNKNQDKSLDVIVKNGKEVFFIEAKHLNTGGGGQNKQVLELIEIIRKNNAKNNYHFVAFLDGVFSNTLLSAGSEAENKEEAVKTKLQYKDI